MKVTRGVPVSAVFRRGYFCHSTRAHNTGWSKSLPSFIFGITSVIQHRL